MYAITGLDELIGMLRRNTRKWYVDELYAIVENCHLSARDKDAVNARVASCSDDQMQVTSDCVRIAIQDYQRFR